MSLYNEFHFLSQVPWKIIHTWRESILSGERGWKILCKYMHKCEHSLALAILMLVILAIEGRNRACVILAVFIILNPTMLKWSNNKTYLFLLLFLSELQIYIVILYDSVCSYHEGTCQCGLCCWIAATAVGGRSLCSGDGVQARVPGILWMLLKHTISFCKIFSPHIAGARAHLLGYREESWGQAVRNNSVIVSVLWNRWGLQLAFRSTC